MMVVMPWRCMMARWSASPRRETLARKQEVLRTLEIGELDREYLVDDPEHRVESGMFEATKITRPSRCGSPARSRPTSDRCPPWAQRTRWPCGWPHACAPCSTAAASD